MEPIDKFMLRFLGGLWIVISCLLISYLAGHL